MVPPAAYLRLSPFVSLTRAKNDVHTVTVAAGDNAERAIGGLPVRLVVTGGHARVLEAVTDAGGAAAFSYQGTIAGAVDFLEAQADYGATVLTAPNVVVTWSGLPNAAPVVNAGPDTTVGLNESLTLNGAVSDDGQPAGAALTVTWSKVSGPGWFPRMQMG